MNTMSLITNRTSLYDAGLFSGSLRSAAFSMNVSISLAHVSEQYTPVGVCMRHLLQIGRLHRLHRAVDGRAGWFLHD